MEASGDIGSGGIIELDFGEVLFSGADELVANGGFEPGEAEVETRFVVDERAWEGEAIGVAGGGEFGEVGTAGKGDAEHDCDLIEGFAGGIIDGTAEVGPVDP